MSLRSPLSLLQRPKPVWENPELSIGPFCGVAKGGLKYRDAQGPAQEAYDQICTEIQQVLNSSCGPVRYSSAVVYDIYMVGRGASTAVPHIMFSCKQAKSRKQAVAAVRKSGIMQRSPGIELGHWEYPPHILNLRLLAASGITEDADFDQSASDYFLRPIPDPDNSTETLAIQFEMSGSTDHHVATIGSVTEHNGKLFYVVPQHIFPAPYTTDIDSELEDSSDCEFGAFASDDQVSDEEAEFTSQYSISPPSSEADSDSESDAEDIFSEGELHEWTLPVPEESMTTRNSEIEYDETLHMPLPLPKGGPLKRLAKDPIVSSQDLDYALLEVDSDERVLTGLPVMSEVNVSRVSSEGAAVTTVTGAGHLLHGRLSGRVSYVRAPNAAAFQKAFMVDLNGPLHPGDCGSIVRDSTTGKIYGHIFLGSIESGMAYIMPAAKILRDVRSTFERMDEGIVSSTNDTKDFRMGLSTTSITPTPPDSHHQLMVRWPPIYQEYKVAWICEFDFTVAAATAILDDIHPTSTSRVENTSVAPSACLENSIFAVKPTQKPMKCWFQRNHTNQYMEGARYRDETPGGRKGLCYEMEAVDHIYEPARTVPSYLTDSGSHMSEHRYAEMVSARFTEMPPDLGTGVAVRVGKREHNTELTRVEDADILAATEAPFLRIDFPDPEKAHSMFISLPPDECLTGLEETPVGAHEGPTTQEYRYLGRVFVMIWENGRRG